MPLKPGTKRILPIAGDGYAGSMAKDMEDAFLAEWQSVMGNAVLPAANDQMRLMFIAIARGVVKHLEANKGSFHVSASNGSTTVTGTVSAIDLFLEQ